MTKPRALLSVFDKCGIADFARGLVDMGCEIVSTGGTHSAIQDAGVQARKISEITGFPEILGGRVKTLHPAVHGGLLARRDTATDQSTIDEMGIAPIQVLACNLYPFASTLSAGRSQTEVIEQIDIGGPAMIRSAAKNAESVYVVVDPQDYGEVLEALGNDNGAELRQRLAAKAFEHTSVYDSVIAAYLRGQVGEPLPAELALPMTKIQNLRYGENPHQSYAAFYAFGTPDLEPHGLASAKHLHGPDLSYNNVLDAAAAWEMVNDFDQPAVAVIKHGNPCGFAVGGGAQEEIYRRAYEGDTVSIFGGIVATNRPLTVEMAKAMRGVLLHVIIAPDFDSEALKILRRRKQARILKGPMDPIPPAETKLPLSSMQIQSVPGGFLVQSPDHVMPNRLVTTVVSDRKPSEEQMLQLRFAWRTIRHVKSNAIVLAKESSLVGVGAGQMSRVDSVFMALHRAGDRASGSALASDAFFPFPDGPELALEAGVEAIIEPGGSKGDAEVIEVVNRYGGVLVFTNGERHFRH